jgi:DNA (cytosine-5)-methyltransferase 1
MTLDRTARRSLTAPERRVLEARVRKRRFSPRYAVTHFEELWTAAKGSEGVGPIDVIDMFSGCGGMSAGFAAVNAITPAYHLIGAVDIDQVANETYTANLPIAPSPLDVAHLAQDRRRLKGFMQKSGRRPGKPLVLIGCAPCQGFSSHRNSRGQSDERNPLFVDFARVATMLQPNVVVAENVPELLTYRYWPYVAEARKLLEQAGYYVHLGVHNMAHFGVPQERFRAVMLAFRRPFSPLRGIVGRGEFRTVRDAVGDLPPVAAGVRHPMDPMHYCAGHKESTLATIRAVPKDGGSRPWNVGPACLRRVRERQGRGAYEDVYGRLAWDRPSITVTAYARNPASGRYIHPEQDRGLTVREAACLQGFPKDYWFAGSLDERFRQIGNAVPPSFAAGLAAHVLGELLFPAPGMGEPGIETPVGVSFSRLIPALKAGLLDLGGSPRSAPPPRARRAEEARLGAR